MLFSLREVYNARALPVTRNYDILSKEAAQQMIEKITWVTLISIQKNQFFTIIPGKGKEAKSIDCQAAV